MCLRGITRHDDWRIVVPVTQDVVLKPVSQRSRNGAERIAAPVLPMPAVPFDCLREREGGGQDVRDAEHQAAFSLRPGPRFAGAERYPRRQPGSEYDHGLMPFDDVRCQLVEEDFLPQPSRDRLPLLAHSGVVVCANQQCVRAKNPLGHALRRCWIYLRHAWEPRHYSARHCRSAPFRPSTSGWIVALLARGLESGNYPANVGLGPTKGLRKTVELRLGDLPGSVGRGEDAPVGGHRIQHHRAVGGDDDLQIVAQRELLQLQHEELLDPGVEAGLDLVDENQSALELGDLPRKAHDGAFPGGHVQLGIGRAAFLGGEEQALAAAGQVDDLGIRRRPPRRAPSICRSHCRRQ